MTYLQYVEESIRNEFGYNPNEDFWELVEDKVLSDFPEEEEEEEDE